MSEQITGTLADLKTPGAGRRPAAETAAVAASRKVDAQGRAYATGKRKNAIARVWIKPGKGKITSTAATRSDLFRPSGAADDDRPAASASPTAPASSTSIVTVRARASPARPAPSATASPRR